MIDSRIPDATQFRSWVIKLSKSSGEIRVTLSLRPPTSRTPELPQSIHKDALKPGPKSPWSSRMLEVTHVIRDGKQDFLNEIVRITGLHVVSTQPGSKQWRVQVVYPVPRTGFWRLLQS